MESWYVVKTKPNREFMVRDQLVTRGIETYLPLWKPVQLSNVNKKLRPYFPCYLFVNLDLQQTSMSSVAYLPGVNYLITCDDQPVRVEQSVIHAISARLQMLENTVTDRNGKPLLHGDKVIITTGVFDGYEAIFDKHLSSGDRVRLLINFLQKRTPLTIERTMIQKH